jgi:hypothetical protein
MDFYSDKAGVFFVNAKKRENWTEEEMRAGKCLDKTQFGKIAEKLGINLIGANAPQAKGRIERLWETLQDRPPSFFTLEGIHDVEAANKTLPEFIAEYNGEFAVQPASNENYFVPLSKKDDLEKLPAVKFERATDSCGCFSFQNYTFSLETSDRIVAKKKIVFTFSEKIGFMAEYDKRYYPVKLLGYLSKRASHIPDVTRFLLEKFYSADAKQKQP